MTTIKMQYLGNKVDIANSGFFNALGKEALRREYTSKVQNKIKEFDSLDNVIKEFNKNKYPKNIITPNTIFIITIDQEEYYLSHRFKLISKDEFEKLNFVPYIKFDKSNCDILKEQDKINQILKYKSSNEAISFIEDYISKTPKSFKNISDTPNKIFLYFLYKEKPKAFDIP